MGSETLAGALEREHRAIDGGIETFTTALAEGKKDTEPLVQAMDGLRRHIYLEEQFLFPPLRTAGLMIQIFAMLKEHGELWRSMDGLDALLGADSDSEAILYACREFLAQLAKHNKIEEPVIYTQADKVLSAPASAELSEFLAAGQMPEGWACAKAKA
jgi:regulator of cell morphogenesis and NO signaling